MRDNTVHLKLKYSLDSHWVRSQLLSQDVTFHQAPEALLHAPPAHPPSRPADLIQL